MYFKLLQIFPKIMCISDSVFSGLTTNFKRSQHRPALRDCYDGNQCYEPVWLTSVMMVNPLDCCRVGGPQTEIDVYANKIWDQQPPMGVWGQEQPMGWEVKKKKRGMNWECIPCLQQQLLWFLLSKFYWHVKNYIQCSSSAHPLTAAMENWSNSGKSMNGSQHVVQEVPQLVAERKNLECFYENSENQRIVRLHIKFGTTDPAARQELIISQDQSCRVYCRTRALYSR